MADSFTLHFSKDELSSVGAAALVVAQSALGVIADNNAPTDARTHAAREAQTLYVVAARLCRAGGADEQAALFEHNAGAMAQLVAAMSAPPEPITKH